MLLRTTTDLRHVVAGNSFADRNAIDRSKLLVTFLSAEPDAETNSRLHSVNPHPEEVYLFGRELFIYFPDGIGGSKLTLVLERILKTSGTSRKFQYCEQAAKDGRKAGERTKVTAGAASAVWLAAHRCRDYLISSLR